MAHKHGIPDGLLHFVSASRSRSAVMLAAVSFAIFHVAVMATTPGPGAGAADMDLEIPRQLMHFAAVICRFVLPLGFMLAGVTAHARAAASDPGRTGKN